MKDPVEKYICPVTSMQWERRYSSYSFLISALSFMGEWSESKPGRALHLAKSPSKNWIEGWMSLGAGLDADARGKILCFCRGSNPGRPFCSQTL
jgi:hypothetical protein